MRFGNGHFGINPHMKLYKIMRAARPSAQIMNAFQFGMLHRHRNELLLPVIRPFLIHQLVEGLGGGTPRAPNKPHRNDEAKDRISARKSQILVKYQRHNHRAIERQITGIMKIIRLYRYRFCTRNHHALIGNEYQCREDRNGRYRNTIFGICCGLPILQPLNSAPANADGRNSNHHDLEHSHQSFRLTVTEPVIIIRRARGDAHTRQ